MSSQTETLEGATRFGAGSLDVVAEARAAAARRAGIRRHLMVWGLVIDAAAALLSYEIAVVFFAWVHDATLELTTSSVDWSLPILLGVLLLVCAYVGLYKLEVWVSRPLHLMTLLRATVVALVVSAFIAFAFKAPLLYDSRLTVFVAFVVFFVLSATLRFSLLDRCYRRHVREHPGTTLVVGWAADGGVLVSRLKELRGYAQVRTLEPKERSRNGWDAEPELLRAIGEAQPAPRQVFLDGGSLGHKATFDLIAAARRRGCEVYVTGRLGSPLDATGLLARLFEIPMMRVHRDPGAPLGRAARISLRLFDIVSSATALVLLSPLFAVIAIAVKRDSRGPVFFHQERVGRHGRTFEFLKFRSMTVGNDAAQHRASVAAFIHGELVDSMAGTDEYGRVVYKIAADARVTRVGHFLRRYSLDELPQFWNVLKGDMSMVGPRPALAYEVEAYTPWHRRRLEITPGVSGLWQIAGRSRVDFDDMVFQDVMYSLNESLFTDLSLCLRTVPAVLMGTGAT